MNTINLGQYLDVYSSHLQQWDEESGELSGSALKMYQNERRHFEKRIMMFLLTTDNNVTEIEGQLEEEHQRFKEFISVLKCEV